MLSKEERIALRDELIKVFNENHIISFMQSKGWYILNRISLRDKFLENNKYIKDKYNKYISEFRSEDEGFWNLVHVTDMTEHVCPICGNTSYFRNKTHGYKMCCENKECYSKLVHSEEVRAKAKATMKERYDSEYSFSSPILKEKIKETNRRKYNVDYPMSNDEIKAKSKQTCMAHFNVDNPMRCEEVKAKSKQTCLDKYNVDHPMRYEEIKNKVKQTMQDKYGVDCSLQIHVQHYDIWNDDEKFRKFIIDKYNEKGIFLVLNDINDFFNVHPCAIKRKAENLNLLEYFYIPESNLEATFKIFLSNNNIMYKLHDRHTIYDDNSGYYKEIDFLCSNIGFEINDISSHNYTNKGNYAYHDKEYHLNKVIKAKEKNIHLVHLWEWELRNEDEWNVLSKWILNLLNNDKIRIGARKCIIKDVSLKEEKEFLNNYHLQGYKKSERCLGLYYNNELIALESFCKPRYNNNYQWELLRLCTKYGYSIIGGAKRLLDYFIKHYDVESIISYCNLDKFTGKVYTDIGFKLLKNTGPQLIWCNKDMKHFTNASLNWIGADKMIGTNYGKGTDNEEIVQEQGYVPIYNCGLAVYTLTKENILNENSNNG